MPVGDIWTPYVQEKLSILKNTCRAVMSNNREVLNWVEENTHRNHIQRVFDIFTSLSFGLLLF